MKIKVAPSLLSADFSCLEKEIERIESAGADMLHIDVMDGHFVPNLTVGPVVVKNIRRCTKLPLDVHLMIERPECFIDDFIEAGSDILTMHIEAISRAKIKSQKPKFKHRQVKLGISLNPATPLEKIYPVLDLVDLVLIMSVNPGFAGQKFMPLVLPKIKQLRSIFSKDIAVDGGINDKIAAKLIRAGANILASGSYIFSASNPREAIERIRNAGK